MIQLLRKRVGLSVAPAREAVRVDQEGKFTPLHQARCDWQEGRHAFVHPARHGQWLALLGTHGAQKGDFQRLGPSKPASAELYILVRAGWNLVPGPCVDAGETYRKMARLHAEQHLLKLLQTEAVTFRDVLQMCYLWSGVPLTASV